MALTGAKALTMWCKQMTDGYKDVEVRNMTSSWRDGLAFCAILHHYRPDLINFDKLSKENIAENNYLAFTVAEDELGIPALLDVEDMVQMEVPDKLSILTYVSQYYNYFKDKIPGEIPKTPKRHATKRQSPYKSEDSPKKRPAGDVPGISATKEVIGSTPDPNISKGTLDRFCANCGKTVYLMERMQVEGKIFHRVCFVCALCEIQLRMGTYRYIPTEEKFYCDRHYRQRTTSTSTDDSSRPKNGNQKNEQDALKNLLESLENKRKQATQNEDDKMVMKHASVHERIANARKRFTGGEQMETDYERQEEVKENVEKNSESKDLTLGAPRHRPPRPMQLPGRPPDSTSMAEASIAVDVDIIETPNVQEIPKRPALPSILLSNDESKMKEAPVRPARPTSPPGHSSKQHRSPYENTTPKDLARGILTDVLMKAQNDSKSIEDKGGVHIYETPFANVTNEKGVTNEGGDVLFENPRYRESIKIETKPVYENTGAALLSLEDKRVQRISKEIRQETESESNESDIDLEMRPKSHSTSSDDRKRKKLVLKVKKKKKAHETHEGETNHTGIIEKQTGSDSAIVGKEDQAENEEAKKEDTEKMEEDLTADEKCPDNHSHDTIEENESKVEEIEDLKTGELTGRDGTEESMEGGEPTKEEGITTNDDGRKEFENVETKPELPQTPELDQKMEDIKDEKFSGDEEKGRDSAVIATDDGQKESFEDEEDSTQNEDTNDDKLVESNIVENDGLQEKQPYESHGNGMQEPQPYASHGNGEKKRKVLKYVNPFDDSDEDEVSNKQLESRERKKIVLNPFEDSSDTECDSKEDLHAGDLPPKEDELMDDAIGRVVSRKIKLVAGEGPKTPLSPEQMEEHQRRIENLKKGLSDSKEKSYKNPFEDSDDDLLDEPREVKPKNQSEEHKQKKVLVLKVKKKKYKAPAPPVEQSTLAEPVEKDNRTVDNYEQDDATTKPPLVPADPLETFKTYVENSEIEVRKRMESRGGELYSQRQGQPGRPMSPLSVSCPALDKNEPQSVIDNDFNKTSSSGHLPEGVTQKESDDNQDGNTEKVVDRKNEDVKESGDESKEPMTVQKEKPPKRPAPPVPKGITPYKESPPMPHVSAVANQNKKIDAGEATKVVVSKEKEINESKGVENEAKSKGQKSKEIEKQKGKNLKEGEKQKGKNAKESEKKEKKSEVKKKEKDKKKKAKKGEKNETEKNIQDKQEKEIEEDEVSMRLERTYTFIEDKPLTIDDIGQELKEIEAKQRVLERKGVEMEKRLREQLHGDPEEDYMVTWFDLVTEKNRLLRRENELIYMSQEIDYHEYQKKIEYELRLLMEKDESTKTDEDRQAEEQLLQQLVNYVSRRNKIVEKIEQDRIREREEDEQIQMIMQAQGLRKQKKKKAGKKNSTGSVFYS